MKRAFLAILCLVFVIVVGTPCSAFAAAEGPLYVYEGNTLKRTYSFQELKDRQETSYYQYSGYNTYATYNSASLLAKGPKVSTLLQDAGIDPAGLTVNDTIQIKGSDGFGVSLTGTQLLAERYYFPNGKSGTDSGKKGSSASRSEAVSVPVIIDLVDTGDDSSLRLGQIAPNEQNWPAKVKYMTGSKGGKIIVNRGAAKTLAADIQSSAGTGGYLLPGQPIILSGGNHYTKIYYTTNGSEPTINSDIYNYNTYPGNEQNVSLKAPQNEGGRIIIKCRKIAYGSKDSTVQTFSYTVNSTAVTAQVSGQTFRVTKSAGSGIGTVTFTKAKNAKSITVPATVKLADGKTYNVTTVGAKAFTGSKIRTVTIGKNVSKLTKNALYKSKATKVIVKTKKLKKSTVKGSLKGSKVKKVQVKVGTKKQNTTYVKKYKKIFTKKNAGRKVTVTR